MVIGNQEKILEKVPKINNLQGLENVIKLILMVKNIVEFQKAMDLNAMLEKILATEVIIISAVFIVYLVANDVTGVGVIDDAAIIPVAMIIWEAAQVFA